MQGARCQRLGKHKHNIITPVAHPIRRPQGQTALFEGNDAAPALRITAESMMAKRTRNSAWVPVRHTRSWMARVIGAAFAAVRSSDNFLGSEAADTIPAVQLCIAAPIVRLHPGFEAGFGPPPFDALGSDSSRSVRFMARTRAHSARS